MYHQGEACATKAYTVCFRSTSSEPLPSYPWFHGNPTVLQLNLHFCKAKEITA